MSETKYIDHLDEDEPIKNQAWACISFISPEGIKNCSVRGLKIRGVYATKEEADKQAKHLQEIDQYFHVFVGEVGKWLPWDPDPNSVEDQQYQNEELNDLMKGYKDNLEKSKTMQHQRKQDMIKKAAKEEQQKIHGKDRSKSNKTRDRLRKKLAEKHQQEQEQQQEPEQEPEPEKVLTQKEKEYQEMDNALKEEDKLAKAERERLNELNKNISQKKQNVESIDDKLEKIKKLYEKLNSPN